MAPVTTELKVAVKIAGEAGLDKLSRSLINIGKQSKASSVDLRQISAELKQVQQGSSNSISSLRNYRNAWRDIAEQVKIGSKEFKEATREANRLEKQLQRAERSLARGGRFKAGAQIAGTVASAGVLGGPEGALGAGIGALVGGPAGAIVGAGIGAQVGQLRQALGAVAEYGAEINKLRIALQGVTNGQLEYDRALASIQQATQDFAVPQALVTKQFTRLQASVSGAGGSVADTETAFRGIVAAVRATGGSLADVDAALTATAQVFSKGKVSAEELRQQIGERLPGAFTLFAESIGLTPQQLDKALEDGKVTLQDFLTFSRAIFEKYGETAQIIADAPESAGDRLVVSLEQLNEKVAPELTRLGAQFQNFANEAAKVLLKLFEDLDRIGRELERRVNGPELQRLKKARGAAQRALIRTDLTLEQRKLQESFLSQTEKRIAELEFIGPPAPTVPERGIAEPSTLPDKPKGGGRGGTAAERTRERAIEKAIALQVKLERTIRDTAFSLERVGETARQAIQNDYALALQAAIDKEEDLKRVIDELEKDAGQKFPKLTELATELAVGFEDVAAKERDFELFNLRLDELGLKLERFKELADQAFDPAGAAGADLSFNTGTDVFERQAEAIDKLLEKYPQLGEVANSTAELMTFGLRDVIESTKSAQEVFANFLRSIADTLLQSAQQMIAQYIAIGVARMFAFGGSGFNLGANFGGFGGGASSALGGLSFTDLGGFQFASGGVFAKNKIVPFANGGIVKKPTVFPFANGIGLMGEAGPEAIMPLRRTSSGRLGVEASGRGGVRVGTINIKVENSGDQLSLAAQKQLAGQVQGIVLSTLANERRSGGML